MTISNLHTLYNVFLFLTIFFFILTIALFFILDIRRVFMIRTGKAAKKDIRKLEEESFKTGRLTKYNSAKSVYGNSESFGESEEFDRTEAIDVNEPTSKTSQTGMMAGSQQVNQGNKYGQSGDDNATTVLSTNETTVLGNAGETTVLSNPGETTVLSGGGAVSAIERKFVITRKEMHIHTDEVINWFLCGRDKKIIGIIKSTNGEDNVQDEKIKGINMGYAK